MTIATPNKEHVPQAIACLRAGMPVFCEKPVGRNLRETQKLARVANEAGVPLGFAYTYRYSWGMGLVHEIVSAGLIGDVRLIQVYYQQGWLSELLEGEEMKRCSGHRQAVARTDPKISGESCCGGDIGLSHGVIAARYCTGAQFDFLSADMPIMVKGRQLDDNCFVIAKISGKGIAKNARAVFVSSQVMIGEKNGHSIVIAGSAGTVKWWQEDPEKVILIRAGMPEMVLHRGVGVEKVGDDVLANAIERASSRSNLPSGHPMAFHDWLAYAHTQFAASVERWRDRSSSEGDYATICDGLISAAVIHAAVRSNRGNRKWIKVPDPFKF